MKAIDFNDIGIVVPGWLPQTPIEGLESVIDSGLDTAFNQLVQAHSSFGDVGDDSGLSKEDKGYRYTLPVPEAMM